MRLAVFYHCWWRRDAARDIMVEQMQTLKACGLEAAADEIHIGFQGTAIGLEEVQSKRAPTKAAVHPVEERLDEIPTLKLIHDWSLQHPGCKACYFHAKGASHNNATHRWRHCMERAILCRWRECVDFLDRLDSCGAHWMRNAHGQWFWAGNFWWATTTYLALLPQPEEACPAAGRWASELWVSNATRMPHVLDLMSDHPLGSCP